MGKSNRVPMDISDRAKQFMPFAALKGLPEALREVERQVLETSRRDLVTDEMCSQEGIEGFNNGRGEEICDFD